MAIPEFLKKHDMDKKTPLDFFCEKHKEAFGFGKKYIEIDAKKADVSKEKLSKVTRFEFFEGGYPRGYDKKVIYKKNDKYYYAELPSRIAYNKQKPFLCQISEKDATDFFNSIYDMTQIFDWNRRYDADVYDGSEWGVSFGFENGDEICRYGHECWPKSYGEDRSHLMEYFRKLKKNHSNGIDEEIIKEYMR